MHQKALLVDDRWSMIGTKNLDNRSMRLNFEISVLVECPVFAAEVDSQASTRSEEDWRRDGVALVGAWQSHTLPATVTEKILALMDRIQLNYGAMDMILTPDDRYVFIEVNPVGEWFWLDRHAGFHIADALADVLLDRAPRRNTDRYARREWGANR